MKKGPIIEQGGFAAPAGQGNEHTAGQQAGVEAGDACRCKEVSTLSPKGLLKLMIGDLTFWRKADKK